MHSVESERRPRRGFGRTLFVALALAGACDLDQCTGPVVLFEIDGLVEINDTPAPDVFVIARYDGRAEDTAVTGSDGRYHLTYREGTTVNHVRVVPPAGVHFRETQYVFPFRSAVTIDFEGYREAAVSGRVLAFGQPTPAAQVELDGEGFTRTTMSAADGTYRFDDVPPSLQQDHELDIIGGPAGLTLGPAPVTLSLLGVDRVVDLIGTFGAGSRIAGRVTSAGAGLAGVIVTATGAYTTGDTTQAAGSYVLRRLPPGLYTVAISGFDTTAHRFPATTLSVALTTDTIVEFQAMPIVPNEAPSAAIQQPADGATFTEGTAITFQGSGTDPEDGVLAGAALIWTSSIDGAFGSGATLTVGSLSAGTHTIALTATDAGGLSAAATIAVTLSPAPQQPGSISGAVTANGAPIGGVAVALTGSATASTATDDNGTYSFQGLVPGTYTVTITNPFPGVAFPAQSQTVTVTSGQNVTVTFAGTYGSIPAR